jgi:hypothetical protein
LNPGGKSSTLTVLPVNGNCCISLVPYIVVLMTHGHTNIKLSFVRDL